MTLSGSSESQPLADRAFEMGVDAAREYVQARRLIKPTLDAPPYAHARFLLGRDGSGMELALIAEAWGRGVDRVWADRFADQRN